MNSKKLILGNQVVTYLESSTKDTKNTLLFLHGWMQDKSSFSDIFQILDSKNIAYISLDLPGFGGTAVVSDDMQIEDYGTFVIQFIEKIGLEKPTLVGHSFGGRVSIYLGSFYTNISKIVLIGAAGIAAKNNFFRLAIIKTGKVILSFPGLRGIGKRLKSQVSASDYKASGKMEQVYRNTISNDLQRYMKEVSLPALMIWGEDDDQVTVGEAKVMHGHMQNSQLHILTGSHFIHQEKPQEVSDLILKFIEKS